MDRISRIKTRKVLPGLELRVGRNQWVRHLLDPLSDSYLLPLADKRNLH